MYPETELSPLTQQSSAYIPLDTSERTGRTQKPALRTAAVKQLGPATGRSEARSRSFLRSLLQWAWTVGLLVALIVIVKVYESKHIITPPQKNQYQFLTTAIILLLGLAFADTFKDLARSLKGHIIHRFKPSQRQTELVDGFDGVVNVLRLTTATFSSRWTLGLLAAAWLLIILMVQGAAALLSLTWDIQDGKDYNGTYLTEGTVRVPKLSCYFAGATICPPQEGQDTRAHTFGEMSQFRDDWGP